MTPSFLYPTLAWGLALAAVPVLIHLINLLRQRRVEWAAMEFLLDSQKKNRTWVRLRELLLLLVRMAIIALIVLVAAGPIVGHHLGSLFGSSRIHHVVLLDDSYSMSERTTAGSTFEEAKATIRRIAKGAADDAREQTFTLLRFSETVNHEKKLEPDFFETPIDSRFGERVAKALESLEPSATAVGPEAAVAGLESLLGESQEEERIVYLISDFRRHDWEDASSLRDRLVAMRPSIGRLRLIDTSDVRQSNLTLADLRLLPGNHAVGIPVALEARVINHGSDEAQKTTVSLQQDGQTISTAQIDSIAPGQNATTRFSIRFARPGTHQLQAQLESDPVECDNRRYALVDIPTDNPVLIVDPDGNTPAARTLSIALAPGGPVQTGIAPQVETPRFLGLEKLDKYRAVFLADVDRLESPAIEALERYVADGRGVAFFLGPRTNPVWSNEKLFRDGAGLFPVALGEPTGLTVDRVEQLPDLKPSDHRLFRIFAGKRNRFLDTVKIDRYFTIARSESLETTNLKNSSNADASKTKNQDQNENKKNRSATEILAETRTGAPLVLERRFGKGRVVVILTTASTAWNNWARANPSFVVFLQELQSYLGARPTSNRSHLVGTPLRFSLDSRQYLPEIDLVIPGPEGTSTRRIEARSTPTTTPATSTPKQWELAFYETDRPGLYSASLLTHAQKEEARPLAINVDPEEGNLRQLEPDELNARLDGVPFEYHTAGDYQARPIESEGHNMSLWLFLLLLALLVIEPALARLVSYHPPGKDRLAHANPSLGKGGIRS